MWRPGCFLMFLTHTDTLQYSECSDIPRGSREIYRNISRKYENNGNMMQHVLQHNYICSKSLWVFMIFSFACHDLPFTLGFPLGDPCWSQDTAADHEGCEARSADGTSSSLDDRWKNHAPWIAWRIAVRETNDWWSRSPEGDVRYCKMSATKVEIDSEGWPVWSMFKL